MGYQNVPSCNVPKEALFSCRHVFVEEDIYELVHRWYKCLNMDGDYLEKVVH